MDNMTLIAMASIFTAGLTIALGSIGPALGEGRAVATAFEFPGPAARCRSHDNAHLVRRLAMIESIAIYCFVVSMILISPIRSGIMSSLRPRASSRCSSIGLPSARRRSTSSSWCGC